MKPLLQRYTLTVFDLETTGLDPNAGAEIIEVGAVKLCEGEIQHEFQEFVQPRRSIPADIMNLTGITNEDVADADPVREVLQRLLDYFGEDVLVAHNVQFDLGFLTHYASRPIENPTIDTLKICQAVGSFSSNKLDDLIKVLDIPRDQSHRALDDARATAELCKRIASRVRTVDDYRRCGIPEGIVADVPEIVFSEISGLSTQSITKLKEEYRSVDSLVKDCQNGSITLSLGRGEKEAIREFFRDWSRRDDLYRYLRDYGRGGTVFNCLDVGYWTVINWFWNGVGFVLLSAAIVGTRTPEAFRWFVGLSVPCFLTSVTVIHFRNRSWGLGKQWISGMIFFVFTLIFLT